MDRPVVVTAGEGSSLAGESMRSAVEIPATGHDKARRERPPGYPKRFPVPDQFCAWSAPYPGYSPVEVAGEKVRDTNTPALLASDKLQKMDFDLMRARGAFSSFEGEVNFDEETGRPLNVRGRTGIAGKGMLWRWGANFAADPLVIRFNAGSGNFEMVAIKRDNGEWAIPGGFVDPGESVSRTLLREFGEEAGGGEKVLEYMKRDQGRILYRGYSDDPRNTDNAWIETTATLFFLPPGIAEKIALRAGDDAEAGVRWMPLTVEELEKPLYSNHKDFVLLALAELRNQGGAGTIL